MESRASLALRILMPISTKFPNACIVGPKTSEWDVVTTHTAKCTSEEAMQ